MSRVTCHMSRITCHEKKKKEEKKKKITQSGGASWLRVCYQRGLPRLVKSLIIAYYGWQRMQWLKNYLSWGRPWGTVSET